MSDFAPVIDLPYPLETHGTLAEKALRVPAEMVLQIASGLDEPAEIATRYGYTCEEFTALSGWQPFQQEVAKVRAELEKSGYDFVLDSRLKAKELSNTLFVRAMSSDATFGQVHDAFRSFTEFADLKPKPASATPTQGSAPAFSINIVLNDRPATSTHSAPRVIDLTVEPPPVEIMGTRNPFNADVE